jgi:transcriptional enhancer factor
MFILFKDQAARDKALQTMASMSSAQIVSASVIHNKNLSGASGFGGNDNQSFQVNVVFIMTHYTLQDCAEYFTA